MAFAAVTVISAYVILKIECPRAGFFNLDAYDQVLADMQEQMK